MSTATKERCRVRSETAYGKLSEKKLRALLDEDAKKDCIVVARAEKINRKHYAQLLVCTPSALTRFCHVFAEYEDKLKILTSASESRNFAAMSDWLNKAYDARELELRGEKLDRTAFIDHFGVSRYFLNQHDSPVGQLFKHLDTRLKREGYLPLSTERELEQLRTVLSAGGILDKDRITISVKKLVRYSGVNKHRLMKPPFAEVIADHQANIMANAKTSRVDPYCHGRVFPFSALTPLWSTSFLERVGARFKQTAVGLSRARASDSHYSLVVALKWIGASSNPHCRVVVNEARKQSRVLSANDWEDALYAYREHVIAITAKDRTAHQIISSLRSAVEGLSIGGVLPAVMVPLPGVKNARRRSNHLKSVAEVSVSESHDSELNYVVFARDHFLELCKEVNFNIDAGRADEFIDCIAVELKLGNKLPSDPASAIRLILKSRLNAL